MGTLTIELSVEEYVQFGYLNYREVEEAVERDTLELFVPLYIPDKHCVGHTVDFSRSLSLMLLSY